MNLESIISEPIKHCKCKVFFALTPIFQENIYRYICTSSATWAIKFSKLLSSKFLKREVGNCD